MIYVIISDSINHISVFEETSLWFNHLVNFALLLYLRTVTKAPLRAVICYFEL